MDPEFAKRCLVAAQRAWIAAERYPDRLAPATDTDGGGAYGDDHVDDEFFWAAAELFTTTGEESYRNALERSPVAGAISMDLDESHNPTGSPVSWERVDVLGKITLALGDSRLSPEGVVVYRRQVQQAADRVWSTIASEGYRVPMKPLRGRLPWGSNSWVLGNMVLLGAAADFSGDARYAAGVVDGMDYLLGRNAMGRSYVTGYGTRPMQHPHHRFWAEQANAKYPPPPPGLVSGGPNTDLDDPYSLAAGLKGCAPQKCYMDHIEAYSLNEVAINWNAALAWAAAWLSDWEATGAAGKVE